MSQRSRSARYVPRRVRSRALHCPLFEYLEERRLLAVHFAIDLQQAVKAISPYIYGTNSTISGALSDLTLQRSGGNRLTAYNWTNNYSNAGSDWYFENDNALSSSTTPAAAVAGTITNDISKNAATLLTIPMAGYVSADAKGGNADVRYYPGTSTFDPNWLTDRFKPSAPAKGSAFTTNAAALQSASTVYQDEFVNYLKVNYPAAFSAGSKTPIWFDLDNEPDLWTGTHAEIRPVVAGSVTTSKPLGTPTPVTYAELLQKTVAYATAIKAVAPNTKIFGPVSYGWEGYVNLQNAPDSGANGDFLTYYLNHTAAASKTAGQRLVDVLDLHWYPEATGAGIRITTNDSGYSGSTLTQLQNARMQAPRSLWDPTYTETSWITQSGSGPIQLLPREQAKMTAAANTYGSAYAPNQLSISEYNYGGGDDVSGGIAEADVLGIFGKQGLFEASEWPLSGNEPFIAGGFNMYRNFDGANGTFGDTSVQATTDDVADSSVYASYDSANPNIVTLVAINKTASALPAVLALAHVTAGSTAHIYQLTNASSTPASAGTATITDPTAYNYTMPAYSVSTIRIVMAASSVPAAPTGLTATGGNGQVGLSWGASTGAASYNIYRSTASGGEGATPYKTGITATSYTDTSVTNGTPYYYQVTAVNTSGQSAKSTEKSATPQAPQTAPATPASFAAASGVGQVVLTWVAPTGATSYKLYRSTTAGGEGSTPYKTGLTGTSYTDTSVNVGQPYYYQITATNSVGDSPRSAEKTATPQGTQSSTAKAFANGRANDMVYDNSGRLYLAYYDASEKTLKYASRSAGGTWSSTQTIDTATGAGQYLSLGISSTGLLAVAYYDATNADLKYAQYNGNTWDNVTVDSPRKVGLYPSLAFDAAGHPVISYYHKTYGDLKLAAWTGSAWAISTVDANADSGRYSSLAANPTTGRWSISYEDDTDGTFRVADQTKSGWGFTTVDDTQGGGGYTSLAFTTAGQAGLTYYDAWNTNLKFATRAAGSSAWTVGTVASAGSVGMYGQLHYASGSNVANVLFYNKTADGVMSCSGYAPGLWSTTQIVTGGGRELSAAWSVGGKRTLGWFDTASVGLLVQDM